MDHSAASGKLSDCLRVLKDILGFRPEEVTSLVRRLDSFQQSVRNASEMFHDVDEKCTQDLVSQVVQAYKGAVTSAKLARSLEKVFKAFPKQIMDDIEEQIQNTFKDHIVSKKICDMHTVSGLLDQNASVKKCLVQPEMFVPVSSFLRLALTSAVSNSETREDDRTAKGPCVYTSVKFSIQVMQLLTPEIRASLTLHKATPYQPSTQPHDATPHQPLVQPGNATQHQPLAQPGDAMQHQHSTLLVEGFERSVWEDIALTLMQLFFKSTSRDLLLLLGTSLAMILKALLAEDKIGPVYKELLLTLEQGKECFTMQGLTVPTKPCLSQHSDVSNHKAAVIKGLLVCCAPSVLCQGGPASTEPLMLTVFPYITQLCQGQTTHLYIAFQLLALWFQKIGGCDFSLFTSDSLGKINSVIDKSSQLTNNQKPGCGNSRKDAYDSSSQENFQVSPEKEIFSQESENCDFMGSDCPILRSTLDLVWLNWDSPVDGVTEYAVDIFRKLLKVWQSCVTSGVSSSSGLAESLLEQVLAMPWHSKTRYPPLGLLLPYVDVLQLFGDEATINEDLLKCLKSNSMVAVASDVYKTFLQIVSAAHKDKVLEIWKTTWMNSLFKGLTSTDSLQQLKTCTYWLPATLQLVPGSDAVLLQECARRLNDGGSTTARPLDGNWLFAWVTISRTARELLHSAVPLQSSPLLLQALQADQETVRSEAIMLLCSTVTRTEPVTELEVALLKEFLPVNLKTDSAPLRQQVTSALKKMAARIRDSCVAACRNKDREARSLTLGVGFVDWLYCTLMSSLLPGGSYQRRQTCLDLVASLLEILVYRDVTVTARKGKARASSSILLQYAQSQGKWNFFSREHLVTLLVCLEDGADQIQRQSYTIVVQYFTEPLHVLLSEPLVVEHLMERALWRVDCHRAHQSHSGLLILQLLFDRCLLGSKSRPSLSMSPSCRVILSKVKADSESPYPVMSFLTGLINQLDKSFGVVREGAAASFKMHPMHGLTQCISQCLLDTSRANKSGASLHQGWLDLLRKTLDICQGIIDLMLAVLAGRGNQENCPSFADMGSALDKLVTTGQGQDEEEEEVTTLSPEFQLVLSWCWINLKESCCCLGTACEVAMEDWNPHLSETDLREVGDVFVRVLTTCRHRGAIEGCRAGFFLFCSALLNTKDPLFSNIPKLILDKVLSDLRDNSLTASVTRRSAGLPIIVLTVLQAARSLGNTSLLLQTVDDLYTIASRPVSKDIDQQLDLCQSHALNILKVIFSDASLCGYLVPQLAKVSVLVVQGFDSPHWAIRNAATQLISTLMSRIFGQHSKSSICSSTTLEEFESRYPALMQCICQVLEDSVDRQAMSMHPSLYVVLTLLANLAMSSISSHSCRSREFLKTSVVHFLSSPVHSLRKLSAQAYVALSPFDREDAVLMDVLHHIKDERLSMNSLHGWCLVAHALVMGAPSGSGVSLKYLHFVVDHSWLFDLCPSCLTVSSLVMETSILALGKVTTHHSTSGGASRGSDSGLGCLLHNLWDIGHRVFTFLTQDRLGLQVGREHSITTCLNLLSRVNDAISSGRAGITNTTNPNKNMSLASSGIRADTYPVTTDIESSKIKEVNAQPQDSVEHVASQFESTIVSGLTSAQAEVHGCVLDLLAQQQEKVTISPSVQLCVWKLLLLTKQVSMFQKCVTLILRSALTDQLTLPTSTLTSTDLTGVRSVWGSVTGAQGSMFVLEGLLWAHLDWTSLKDRLPLVGAWCSNLSTYTSATANENTRLLAAQCVRLAGPNILNACCQWRTKPFSEIIVGQIVLACVVLLDDCESQVRHETTLFLCALAQALPCHSNLAHSLLHAQIVEKFFWCDKLLHGLLALVYPEHALTDALRAVDRSTSPLFEPEVESVMYEPPVRLLWAFCVLRDVCSSKASEIVTDRIQTHSQVAGLELKEYVPRLRKNLTEHHLYSLTSEESVSTSLLGLRCLAALERERHGKDPYCSNTCVETSPLQSNTACLFEMPNIYPVLRNPSFLDTWREQFITKGESLLLS